MTGKGKLTIVVSIVVAGLAAFGVIDKKTAEDILSATRPQATSVQPQISKSLPPKAVSAPHKTLPSDSVAEKNTVPLHGWSKTQPEINLTHIFSGEINRSGKPTGFHSRPGGVSPKTARLNRIKGKANRVGVYTAQVEIFDQKESRWKSKFSTMFPDNMSYSQVIERIVHAYKNRRTGSKEPWRGPSGKGFQIEGYMSRRGGINTAYPVYVRN